MQLPDHLDVHPTDLAVPTFHTERLKLVPISPFNYVTYRAFIMFEERVT